MGRNRRRDKLESLRERLESAHEQLLIYIDESADEIENMGAGQIYSPYGAQVVNRLDALTSAEDRLSEAIEYLKRTTEPERENRAAE